MNARKKLNTVYVTGSILLAGGIGFLTDSWTIFGVSLGIILAWNMYDGSIRPKR